MAAFLDISICIKQQRSQLRPLNFFVLLKVKLEVVFLYPAYFSKDKAENP